MKTRLAATIAILDRSLASPNFAYALGGSSSGGTGVKAQRSCSTHASRSNTGLSRRSLANVLVFAATATS